MKIDARVAIRFLCCGNIQLIHWNFAAMLVEHVKRVPGQHIVADLLRVAAILKNQSDFVLRARIR